MRKPILCLDFDGVLHSYTSGWQGADVVADNAVPGAWEFLDLAVDLFDVQVYSSRSNQEGGIRAMKEWMAQEFGGAWVEEYITFPTEKPPALITLDDRAICFDGNWPDVIDLYNFKPWNKR